MIAKEISIEKAKKDKLFYVVANVVVYRKTDQRCLILKRSEKEIAHPGKYGVVGGKLEWNDLDIKNPDHVNGDVLDFHHAVEKLLIRETKEEAGVLLENSFKYMLSKSYIRPDGIPVLLLKFTAMYNSGDVILEENSFSNFAWVNEKEVYEYDCIDGIPNEIEQSIGLWNI